jgi:WxcM-like, C-terminal
MCRSRSGGFSIFTMFPEATRAGHALKTCQQFIIAMSGSFDVILDDGTNRKQYHLNRSYTGLYVPPLIWRELENFSSGSVCTVLASEVYDENGYYRDYEDFRNAIHKRIS